MSFREDLGQCGHPHELNAVYVLGIEPRSFAKQ